jgi:hypothetical protein
MSLVSIILKPPIVQLLENYTELNSRNLKARDDMRDLDSVIKLIRNEQCAYTDWAPDYSPALRKWEPPGMEATDFLPRVRKLRTSENQNTEVYKESRAQSFRTYCRKLRLSSKIQINFIFKIFYLILLNESRLCRYFVKWLFKDMNMLLQKILIFQSVYWLGWTTEESEFDSR